jgi:cation diffusion facilitator CzcD-associated flavoprotein CzcO
MNASAKAIRMPEKSVAVIGAGPAGLVSARYLKKHGFLPVVFEAASEIGGQWNAAAPSTGVWPGMRTNTSRVLTAFSDLDHAEGTSVYPKQTDVHGYLQRYAALAGLDDGAIRLSTPVEAVERAAGGGWTVRARHGDSETAEIYPRVVVASGYCRTPDAPEIAGLESFTGSAGVIHSSRYRGPAPYRGRSVLVAGCSISALEIASELAAAGATVSVAMRRQRYVLQKLLAGVPADHVAFTRFAAHAGMTLPPEAVAAGMKQMVLSSSGSPEQFGAPKPDDNIFAAGVTQSQNYLALVAEGRIVPRPWIEAIDGRAVRFADGSSDNLDGVILGTGYKLSLPFLSEEIAATLDVDGQGMDLYDQTLHPDLDGLGFVGLYSLIGPYFPVLELQARWLSYLWAGLRPPPPVAALREGVALAHARRGGPCDIPMHALAVLFASHAGVEPRPSEWPALERALWFGPLSPASFRLVGADAHPEAPARATAAARAFNAIPSGMLTADETARLNAVASRPDRIPA